MNIINENEYSAVIDALKNITDVVAVLTTKINIQDDEIINLKRQHLFLEEKLAKMHNYLKNYKIKSTEFTNIELDTDNNLHQLHNITENQEKIDNTKDSNEIEFIEQINKIHYDNGLSSSNAIITEPTTIGETDIEKAKKYKAIQLVDKLIQKKKEMATIQETNVNNTEKTDDEDGSLKNKKNENKIEKKNVMLKRKNKIMRRF